MSKAAIILASVLQGCLAGNRNSQRQLYEHFYGYAMSISLRYSKNREEAVEILNDAFLKAFTRLHQYDSTFPFSTWLRRILINSAIDYYRKNHHLPTHIDLPDPAQLEADALPMPKLMADEDVLPVLRQLSPAYRTVFNLFVMEGYTHQEIADMLGIDARTSRSNLLRAKAHIRVLMQKNTLNPVNSN